MNRTIGCLLLSLLLSSMAWGSEHKTAEQPTLVSSLYIDFERTVDIQDVLQRAEQGLQLQRKNFKEAQQLFEKLAAELPSQMPASLRRQLRSYACGSNEQSQTEQLLKLSAEWIAQTDPKRDAEERAAYLMCQSGLHFSAARHTEAFALLAEAHDLLIPHPRSIVFAELLLSRGYMSSYLGDIESATKLLTRARELFLQLNVWNGVGSADLYLAHIYRYTGQAAAAREIYQQLLDDTLAEHNDSSLPLLYHSMATTYDVKTDYAQTMTWLNKGIQFAESVDDQTALAHTHLAVSEASVEVKQWAQAKQHALRSQAYAEKLGSHNLALRAKMFYLRVELEIGNDKKTVNEIALLQQEFEQLNDLPSQLHVSELKLSAHKKNQQFELALAESEKLLALHRKVAERNNLESTERMRATYQLERRLEENNRLREQHELASRELNAAREMRTLQLAVLFLAIALLIVIAIWGYRQLKLRHTMQSLALTDELTQLPNRRNVMSYAELQFDQAENLHQQLGIVMLDIDHFKNVNDSFGHDGGDIVLKRVAHALGKMGRTQDRVGRVGGEEFMMVLPGANLDTSLLVAERIRQQVEQLLFNDIAPDFCVTISVGVSCKQAEDEHFTAIISRADAGLYRAKQNGRNRVEMQVVAENNSKMAGH